MAPEGMIPEVWAAELLKAHIRTGVYADFVLNHFGIEIKPLTRRQRLIARFRRHRDNPREWLALKIAPWLYTDPWA